MSWQTATPSPFQREAKEGTCSVIHICCHLTHSKGYGNETTKFLPCGSQFHPSWCIGYEDSGFHSTECTTNHMTIEVVVEDKRDFLTGCATGYGADFNNVVIYADGKSAADEKKGKSEKCD